MATRSSSSNGGSIAIQYEDFHPKSDLLEEPNATILRLHLPNFQKDQITVTYVHSSRVLRVVGERAISSNNTKWSRFNQSFAVPQNCDIKNIQGRFQNGILTITMPKTTQETIAMPTTTEESVPKTAEEGVEQKKRIEKKEKEENNKKKDLGEDDQSRKKMNGADFLVEKVEQVKKRVKELSNEEKRSLVNMGVAVLVIAALGAYVSYTYGSSSSSSSSLDSKD